MKLPGSTVASRLALFSTLAATSAAAFGQSTPPPPPPPLPPGCHYHSDGRVHCTFTVPQFTVPQDTRTLQN